MSLGGGIEPTLHLPVPEIQLLGVTQEEWDGEEELQDEEGEGDEEEEEEGRNKDFLSPVFHSGQPWIGRGNLTGCYAGDIAIPHVIAFFL